MEKSRPIKGKEIRERESTDLSEVIALQRSLKLKCKKIKVSYFKEIGGRGIKCKKNLERGDVLIALPLPKLITPDSSSRVFCLMKKKFNNPQVDLSALLMYESHLQRDSEYYEYLATLPKSYSNLYFCKSDEIKLLPEFMRKFVAGQKENLKNVFDELLDSLKGTVCPHCQAPTTNFCTEENFIWAWFTVSTRSVYYEDKLKSKRLLALAPFLDMFNHSNDAHTKMHMDFENELYVLKTLVPYKKCSQVFIKYGSHSNLTLLMDYGFITDNNPHDFVKFSFNEVLESLKGLKLNHGEITKLKYDLIRGNKLNRNLTKNRDEFSWNFNGLAYVLITRDEKMAVLQSKIYSNQFSPAEKLLVRKVGEFVAEKKFAQLSGILSKMESISADCTQSFRLAKQLVKIYKNLLLQEST